MLEGFHTPQSCQNKRISHFENMPFTPCYGSKRPEKKQVGKLYTMNHSTHFYLTWRIETWSDWIGTRAGVLSIRTCWWGTKHPGGVQNKQIYDFGIAMVAGEQGKQTCRKTCWWGSTHPRAAKIRLKQISHFENMPFTPCYGSERPEKNRKKNLSILLILTQSGKPFHSEL